MSARVYKAYADDGTLLYVGKTTHPVARLTHHRSQSEWWQQASTVALSDWMDDDSAARFELGLIGSEAPAHNVSGVVPEGSTPLARIVAAAGYSGRQFASVLGLTNSTTHRLLRGDRALMLDEAVKAAAALGCDVRDLSTEVAA